MPLGMCYYGNRRTNEREMFHVSTISSSCDDISFRLVRRLGLDMREELAIPLGPNLFAHYAHRE